MNYHKIRGVPINVCACEQKIAYNIAFGVCVNGREAYRKAKEVSEICASDFVLQLRDEGMKRWTYNAQHDRYDEDAIFAALNAGLRNYLENYFIASGYEQIGKAFPALYLTQSAIQA